MTVSDDIVLSGLPTIAGLQGLACTPWRTRQHAQGLIQQMWAPIVGKVDRASPRRRAGHAPSNKLAWTIEHEVEDPSIKPLRVIAARYGDVVNVDPIIVSVTTETEVYSPGS